MRRCRSIHWASRFPIAGSPSSPPLHPISPARATRVPERPTMRQPNSTPSIRATRAGDPDLRISHVAIDRDHTTAEDPGTYFPLRQLRASLGLRPDRIARLPLSRPADQSQPPRDARSRLPGDRRPLQGRRRRCGDPRAELSGLPPERQPRGAHAGGKRHRHGDHGLREGHRRACRRAAFPVLRFPARQFRRPSERPAVAGDHPRSRLDRARNGDRSADDGAIPIGLERGSGLEDGLLQHRAPVARGDCEAARRVRQTEGNGAEAARSDRLPPHPMRQAKAEDSALMPWRLAGRRIPGCCWGGVRAARAPGGYSSG